MGSGGAVRPPLPLALLLGTLIFLVLAWGPLAAGRGGGITGVQALQLDDPPAALTRRAQSSLDLHHQLARLPLLALTHGAGLAVGTESPSAALGAACLLALREKWRALQGLPRSLTAAIGAGAGLGAAFRSPLLEATYAFEELSAEKGLPLLLPTLLLAGVGSLVNSGLGQPARLQETLVTGLAPALWPWAFLFTLLAALVGVGFVKALVAIAPRMGRLLRRQFWPTALGMSLVLTLLAMGSGGVSLNDGSLNLGAALAGQPGTPGGRRCRVC